MAHLVLFFRSTQASHNVSLQSRTQTSQPSHQVHGTFSPILQKYTSVPQCKLAVLPNHLIRFMAHLVLFFRSTQASLNVSSQSITQTPKPSHQVHGTFSPLLQKYTSIPQCEFSPLSSPMAISKIANTSHQGASTGALVNCL